MIFIATSKAQETDLLKKNWSIIECRICGLIFAGHYPSSRQVSFQNNQNGSAPRFFLSLGTSHITVSFAANYMYHELGKINISCTQVSLAFAVIKAIRTYVACCRSAVSAHLHVLSRGGASVSWQPLSSFSLWIILSPPSLPVYCSTGHPRHPPPLSNAVVNFK